MEPLITGLGKVFLYIIAASAIVSSLIALYNILSLLKDIKKIMKLNLEGIYMNLREKGPYLYDYKEPGQHSNLKSILIELKKLNEKIDGNIKKT